MPLDIAGFAVLARIAAHPAAFQEIAKDATAAARTLVVKQIKSKATGLQRLRDIRAALQPEAFGLVMDGLPDAQIKSLLGKLDKHNPQLGSSTPEWRRQQVLALASGSAEPAAKVKAPPKPKPAKTAKPQRAAPEVLNYASAGATRRRRTDQSEG